MRLVDADALLCPDEKSDKVLVVGRSGGKTLHLALELMKKKVQDAETVVALPVTKEELRHLMNDTIAYIWRLEDNGCADKLHGYDSRKALLEKLKRFDKEHFPEYECACQVVNERGAKNA